jgi:hypothetical protein
VIANPLWWPLAFVPAMLALAAFLMISWWSGAWLAGAVQDATTNTFGEVSGFAAAVLAVLVWITAALIAFYALVPPFARLVAAPFMAFFAERAVMRVSGTKLPVGRGP